MRGTAPKAKLVLQSVLDDNDGLGGLPNDLNDLFGPPYKTDKARIHSNSWGSTGNFGVYDQQAHEVDQFVNQHRDMLICFAAGNEGLDHNANGQTDPNSVTPPGTAKNCLTVGACENNRPTKTISMERPHMEAPAIAVTSRPTRSRPTGLPTTRTEWWLSAAVGRLTTGASSPTLSRRVHTSFPRGRGRHNPKAGSCPPIHSICLTAAQAWPHRWSPGALPMCEPFCGHRTETRSRVLHCSRR